MTLMANLRVPLILQYEMAECGLASLAMVCGAYGKDIGLAELRTMFDPGGRGSSLKDLANVAEQLGFSVKSMKVGLKQVAKLKLPAILHWNLLHYVVLIQVQGDTYVIHDPALGRREVSEDEFSDSFTGLAQELAPKPGLDLTPQRSTVGLDWLFEGSRGWVQALVSIFAVSLVMQAFILVVPFALQLLVAQVARGADAWAIVIAGLLGGSGLALYGLMMRMRYTVAMHLSNALDAEGSRRLIEKMFSLPYDFFARREPGSLLNRFANLRELRLLLTQGMAESVVEALLSLVALSMLWVYLPGAAVVGVFAGAAYGAFRWVTRNQQRDRLAEMFQNIGNQNGSLVESIYKIDTIKANGLEKLREHFWMGRYTEYQNSVIRKLRKDQGNRIFETMAVGLGYMWAGLLAVEAIRSGRLEVAESLTAMVLLGIFLSRSSTFVERLFELLIARVHLDSLSEVVHARSERSGGLETAGQNLARRGQIELRDVGFRYSPSEPFVFKKVSFTVPAGQCVAITGQSGCGKSTLLSLLLGLREPTEGEILIDGMPMEAHNLHQLRSEVGVVMQSDKLFYGTVMENVSLFDTEATSERVIKALEEARVADVVRRLPMQEHTMLSDMPMLSGGEVQRLLMARALYKRPRFLLLDEASSHLDDGVEMELNKALLANGATRLMIAHRQQTIDLADRCIVLGPNEKLGCSTVLEDRSRSPKH